MNLVEYTAYFAKTQRKKRKDAGKLKPKAKDRFGAKDYMRNGTPKLKDMNPWNPNGHENPLALKNKPVEKPNFGTTSPFEKKNKPTNTSGFSLERLNKVRNEGLEAQSTDKVLENAV